VYPGNISHCPILGPFLAFALSSDSLNLVLPEASTTGLEIWFDMVATVLLPLPRKICVVVVVELNRKNGLEMKLIMCSGPI
jgi:hypothetical protein